MNNAKSLYDTAWEDKYHIVWFPKYRRKKVLGQVRKHLSETFRELARQRESLILEGHLRPMRWHKLLVISKAKVNTYSKNLLWSYPQLCWRKFLGTLLFRLDGWPGRTGDLGIYPTTRSRRSKAGSVEIADLAAFRRPIGILKSSCRALCSLSGERILGFLLSIGKHMVRCSLNGD